MKRLKLFFACLLMAVLSIGQVWATDPVTIASWTAAARTANQNYAVTSSQTDNSSALLMSECGLASAGSGAASGSYFGTWTNGKAIYITGLALSNYTDISLSISNLRRKNAGTTASFYTSTDGSSYLETALDTKTVGTSNASCSVEGFGSDVQAIKIVLDGGSGNLWLGTVTLTGTPSEGGSDPALSASPTSLAFGTVEQNASVTAKTFTLTGSNLTDANAVTLTAPAGYTVSPTSVTPSSGSVSETITVTPVTTSTGIFNGNITISSADLENDITVGLSMTVEEAFDGLKLTFPFTSSITGWPTANSTTTTNYTYTLSSTDYTFALNNVKCNGTYLMLTAIAKLGLPAIDGYKLVKVEASNSSQCSTATEVEIKADESGDTEVSGGAKQQWSTQSSTYTYNLTGTVANTMYYLRSVKSSKNTQITQLVLYYEEAEAPTVAAPTFNPDGGNFVGSQNVALEQEDSKDIYYTTDATAGAGDPSTSSPWVAYSSEINLTATTTIYAAAKDGEAWSNVVSKTFTKLDELTTMDEIFEKATAVGATPTAVSITFDNWVVTGKTTNNAYVTDGTKGFIIYTSSHGFNVGDILSGTAVCKVQLYNGSAELTELPATKVTVNTGGTVSVNELDAEGIAALTGANTGSLIKISGECTHPDTKYYIAGVQLYNSLYSFSVSAGTSYECTGVYVQYNTNTANTKEILPRSAADIVVSSSIAVTGVTLTESTAEVEVGSTVTLHASVVPGNATDQGIVWSVTSGSDKASVDENGVVTGTAAGEAVIRAASHEDATIFAECTVTVTAADPTKHTVTFDATVDMGESPLSKSNISMACSNGALSNGSEYRLYKSSTTTFECSVGNITKIEFTGVSGNPVSGFGDPEVGTLVTDGNNGVWTGNAASVSFVASGAQVRATLIKITYKEDNREAAGLAWNPAEDIEITVGDAFSAPALQNPNNIDAAEISIESSNTSLATVTAGVVSLVADATGTATITATFAGNDDYKPATISYNITVNEAGLDNVTFDATVDVAGTNEKSITKGGFTLAFTDGALDNGENYRLYKSNTMTLSSTDYLIKKIEFTCTTDKPITGFDDAAGLDKENEEWTGESNTVELTASNAQVRMTKIKVFYVEDTRAAAGLAWNPAEDITLTVGEALSAPALLNPNSIDAAEISIASSNTDVATVTAGVVALVADATGEATITATFAGNASYKPATVSYKITVNPAYSIYVTPSLNVNFGSVNQDAVVADKSITVTLTGVDAATLTLDGIGASAFTISPAAALTASGDITISASSANLGTFAATLTISDDANNAESKVVNLSITVNEVVTPETPVSTTSQWVPATEIVDGMQVLIVGVNNTDYYAMGAQSGTGGTGNNRVAVPASVDGEGVLTPGDNTMSFTLVDQGDETYAIRTSNGKYLYAAASSNNYLKTQDEVNVNAKWTLSTTSAVAEGSSNRNVMQFNSSSSIFSCYGSASQKGIKFYVPKPVTPPTPTSEDVRTGLELNRYYTICLEKDVTAATGATFWNLKNRNSAETEVYLEEVNLPLEAGKPYIFQATATTLNVTYGDETQAAPVENGALRGTFDNLNATELAAKATHVYILIQNSIAPVGTENSLKANRAYIDYDALNVGQPQSAPGKHVRAIPMQPKVATGFDAINASDAPAKLIIDGQIYILRGEKMYDATGRLVK